MPSSNIRLWRERLVGAVVFSLISTVVLIGVIVVLFWLGGIWGVFTVFGWLAVAFSLVLVWLQWREFVRTWSIYQHERSDPEA